MRGRTVTLKSTYARLPDCHPRPTLPAVIACEEDLSEAGIKLLAPSCRLKASAFSA